MPENARVLVVDPDPVSASSLAELLEDQGWSPVISHDAREALDRLRDTNEPVSLVIAESKLPGGDGVSLLEEIRKRHPAVASVVLTGYPSVSDAVRSVRAGAVEYLTKPVVDEELHLALQRAGAHQALLAENVSLRSKLHQKYALDSIVAGDHRMLKIFDLVEAVAPSKTTVLMTGESGTGKSLIARAIHEQSPRSDKPFVQLSCGSIPETLLESELFGHVKGAFTGAHADKPGRFLTADTGTIFLDEINSASPAMQLKLLRVLQERHFEPVGSSETQEVDVRVILATNKPLEEMVTTGLFRQDLYFRINVVTIDLPPLRERSADIPMLAEHFLQKQSRVLGKAFAGLSEDVLAYLVRYSYPGNVRELENIIERAAVLARTPTIGVGDLPEHVIQNRSSLEPTAESAVHTPERVGDEPYTPCPLEEALREPERRIILRALEANDWNRQQTADDLRINRTTLYKKMKSLGITTPTNPGSASGRAPTPGKQPGSAHPRLAG